MSEPTPETRRRLEAVAHAHGFSVAAALCVHRALAAGHGMAQFSHPELGGLGQWAGGGMTMIGEMGNPELRRRVDALCVALAAVPSAPDLSRATPGRATPGPAAGAWGADRGARPGVPAPGALPPAGVPAWTAPRVVDAAAAVAAAPADPAAPAGATAARLAGETARSGDATAPVPPHPDDPLATIARLAGLRASGILTDQEFAAGKTELLGRL